MNWNLQTFISISSILVPSITVLFAILTFRRNRRIENENYIYKSKVEAYTIILKDLTALISQLQKYYFELKAIIKRNNEQDKEDADRLYEISDHVDDLIFKFDDTITSNSLLIPEKVLEKIENLSIKLLGIYPPEGEEENIENLITEFNSIIDEANHEANIIYEAMREDLNSDDLNRTLFTRIKK